MISLKQMRELEPKLAHASDEEVALIREKLYDLGQLMYETYSTKDDSKFPLGLKQIDDCN